MSFLISQNNANFKNFFLWVISSNINISKVEICSLILKFIFLAFRTFWYKITQCGDGGVLQQPQFSTLLQSTLWPFLLLLPFVHMIVTACGLCFSAWKNNAVSSWNLLFGWDYCKKPVCWVFCYIRIFFPYPNVEKLQMFLLM